MAEVLIKGFKMPVTCWSCPFFHTSTHYIGDDELLERHTCLRTGERTDESVTGYLKNCPIVELPPHGKLIDANALWVEINKICDRRDAGIITDLTCVQQLLSAVRHAPTVIPASEVENG